jgi:hypothetical protein
MSGFALNARLALVLANEDAYAGIKQMSQRESVSLIPAFLSSKREIEGKRMTRVLLVWTAFFLLAPTARSWDDHSPSTEKPQRLAPCAGPAYRQFDFWIGDWDVFEIERPTVIVAHARVEMILNGCVLHEVYESLDGHKGESFSIYDVTRNTWHQSWVNDTGYLLTIEGHLRGKSMILEGVDHLPNDKLRQVRGEWRPDEQGTHEIAWRSTDGGVSWVTWFDLSFRSHESSAKTSMR